MSTEKIYGEFPNKVIGNIVFANDVTVEGTINTTHESIIFSNTGLKVEDTDASHSLTIKPNENLTGNKTFNIIIGDTDRTLTLSGNPTIADWFDQSVKAAASPNFNNLILNATLGAERVIDGTFSVVGLGNWTLGAGFSDGTGKAAKAADGTGTLTQAVAIAAVVGTTYKIVYQVLDVTVDGVTLTYGGVSDATKLANGTYTFYVTAITTDSLILTPSSNGSRFSIDNVSVKALTDATGDLVVDGNLEVKSAVTLRSGLNISNGQVLLPDGSVAAPSLSFASDTNNGIFRVGGNKIGIVADDSIYFCQTDGQALIRFGIGQGWMSYYYPIGFTGDAANLIPDVIIMRDAADTFVMRRATNPQTFKLYETYTDVNNYERYALIASGNQLEIKAETLGTGSDDLDIALTPAGTGNVKFGTYAAEVALVAGYITIKDSGGTPRKLAVIA